jgi:hypothetical protein
VTCPSGPYTHEGADGEAMCGGRSESRTRCGRAEAQRQAKYGKISGRSNGRQMLTDLERRVKADKTNRRD